MADLVDSFWTWRICKRRILLNSQRENETEIFWLDRYKSVSLENLDTRRSQCHQHNQGKEKKKTDGNIVEQLKERPRSNVKSYDLRRVGAIKGSVCSRVWCELAQQPDVATKRVGRKKKGRGHMHLPQRMGSATVPRGEKQRRCNLMQRQTTAGNKKIDFKRVDPCLESQHRLGGDFPREKSKRTVLRVQVSCLFMPPLCRDASFEVSINCSLISEYSDDLLTTCRWQLLRGP